MEKLSINQKQDGAITPFEKDGKHSTFNAKSPSPLAPNPKEMI